MNTIKIRILLLLDKAKINKQRECPIKCRIAYLGKRKQSYNDERLIGVEGGYDIVYWFRESLSNGAYKCPKCSKVSLRFLSSFYWWVDYIKKPILNK